MREREYAVPGGSLYYDFIEGRDGERKVRVTRLQGLSGEVVIPERIEDCPVAVVAKKAFLSRKNLRKVTVPASVEEIEDWAFAYCDNLKTVVLSGKEIAFGKSLFLECGGLRYLYVGEQKESVAALLAAAVTTAEASYLLDVASAGSREWLEKWDARMLTILDSADNEGFSKQILCGEEDYGSTDLGAYESRRRKVKVRLLLLRLLYPEELADGNRRRMEEYLRAHTKGCAQEETWQVVLSEHGEDRQYYQLFAELGCVTPENFEGILADVGDAYPEMKAYLMRFKEERLGYADFFAKLDL